MGEIAPLAKTVGDDAARRFDKEGYDMTGRHTIPVAGWSCYSVLQIEPAYYVALEEICEGDDLARAIFVEAAKRKHANRPIGEAVRVEIAEHFRRLCGHLPTMTTNPLV